MVDQFLNHLMSSLPIYALLLIVAAMLYVLGKGADLLVDQAVVLSVKWGVPKVLIGATIVSLGTTLPETAVSVVAALDGTPGLALGNAVGSIICDTGLILGVASLISPLALNRRIVNRQGWLQTGAGFLLVIASSAFVSVRTLFTSGGRLPRFVGFIFLGLLVVYIIASIRWARRGMAPGVNGADDGAPTAPERDAGGALVAFLKLVLGIAMVVVGSKILIPAVEETATRLRIPESIIGATLVAFGTSLPELVTAITSTRKGHGDLAVGNIIGADILNVLFVVGAATAVTPGGLAVQVHFYRILFPLMLIILVTFRIGIARSGDALRRPFGVVLLALYIAATVVSYVFDAVS